MARLFVVFAMMIAFNSARADAPALYTKLEKLFNESTMAYMPGTHTIKTPEGASMFIGCAMADEKQVQKVQPMLAVRTVMTISSSNGPLDPGQMNHVTAWYPADYVKMMFQYGAKMTNGIIDLDNVTFGSWAACTDNTSTRDLYRFAMSGASSDGVSHELRYTCRDGKIANQMLTRKSGEYLLFKIVTGYIGNEKTSAAYGYCWKNQQL